MNRHKVVAGIWTAVISVMAIQIILGFIWMGQNFFVVPSFGDSQEYLNLSKTFQLDEYRPILYPLILRIICEVSERIPIPYQCMVYVIQTIVSFFSILYTLRTLDLVMGVYKKEDKKRNAGRIFMALYFMTIPMISFMNFSVLTDSLANSMLLLFLSGMILLLWYKKVSMYVYGLLAVTFGVQALLRADRLYSILILAVIIFLIRLIKNKIARKQVLAAMVVVCVLIPGCVKGVNHVTQTPGINGRIETNFEFILLDRIVWPNMRANYNDFSEEIKSIIKKKEAKKFDKHNNNVMYQMAPLVEERAGKENAGRIYREMAAVVWKNQAGKVLKDIGEDILAVVFTPVSSLLNAHGLCDKGDSWNITCMSSKAPTLTKYYNFYYLYTFIMLLVAGIARRIIFSRKRAFNGMKEFFGKLSPFIGVTAILALWFCVGDGAPPNDRYALIIYFFWTMVIIAVFGRWDNQEKK